MSVLQVETRTKPVPFGNLLSSFTDITTITNNVDDESKKAILRFQIVRVGNNPVIDLVRYRILPQSLLPATGYEGAFMRWPRSYDVEFNDTTKKAKCTPKDFRSPGEVVLDLAELGARMIDMRTKGREIDGCKPGMVYRCTLDDVVELLQNERAKNLNRAVNSLKEAELIHLQILAIGRGIWRRIPESSKYRDRTDTLASNCLRSFSYDTRAITETYDLPMNRGEDEFVASPVSLTWGDLHTERLRRGYLLLAFTGKVGDGASRNFLKLQKGERVQRRAGIIDWSLF